MAHSGERPTNWDEARGRIDRGEAGDKVASDDPAAAPLGTDAEAGGAPTRPEDVRRSFEQEAAVRPQPRAVPRRSGSAGLWIVLGVGLALAGLLAIAIIGT